MIFEIASINVTEGSGAAFEAAVLEAAPLFRNAKGCRSLRLEKGIEAPSQYRLVVGWDTVDDHMVTFRESPDFQKWRDLAGPYFASPPTVEHVEVVSEAF